MEATEKQKGGLSPRFEREKGAGQTGRAPISPSDLIDNPGRVVPILVGSADLRALEAEGGADVLSDELSEHVEALGLPEVLRRLRGGAEA